MDKFFHPKSIAVVGASEKQGKIGNIIMRNLENQKNIHVYPVNPGYGNITGLKAYPSVLDIQNDVDLAVIAVPAKYVIDVVRECAWKSRPIKHLIIISAGFSEIGKEGERRERELVSLAKKHKLKILGPNCLGLINAQKNLNITFAGNTIKRGNVGLIMQSGALTTALLDIACKQHFGFSLIATLGNKVEIDESDLIEYYAKDKNTKVVAIYLEDIKDGKRFRKILSKVVLKKPVVIIKSGSSLRAQKAIQSHTGAMAGEAEVIREVLAECGAVFCDNLFDFVGTIKMLDGFRCLPNKEIVIITNAGGPGVISTDIIEKSGLVLRKFENETKVKLKKYLPQESSVENPIDVLGDAGEDRYKIAINQVIKDQKLGAVLAIVTPQAQTPIKKIAELICQANKKSLMPVIPVFIGGDSAGEAASVLSKEGYYNFTFPFEAIRALKNVQQSNEEIQKMSRSEKKNTEIKKKRMLWVEDVFQKVILEGRKAVFYGEAVKIGIKYGLNAVQAVYLEKGKIEKGSFDFPLVVKIDSPDILHKFDKEGVFLNISNIEELNRAKKLLQENFGDEGKILAQSQVNPGVELIFGIKKDPSFGNILMFGLGGIFTEILNEKLLWVLPVGKKQIKEKIENSVFGKVFKKQRIDIGVVAGELEKLAFLGIESRQIKELDINPIMFYPDKEPVIVDFKIILELNNT